jgi:hypothetical protein
MGDTHMPNDPHTNDSALTVRWAVIFIFAVLVGIGGGILTYMGSHAAALAVLAGFAAFAAGWAFAKDLISPSANGD